MCIRLQFKYMQTIDTCCHRRNNWVPIGSINTDFDPIKSRWMVQNSMFMMLAFDVGISTIKSKHQNHQNGWTPQSVKWSTGDYFMMTLCFFMAVMVAAQQELFLTRLNIVHAIAN